jgi:uncharacterized phiE125 gp8 family phage protein
MIVRVITPPEPIVTWAEAQKHLRLDDDEEQAYVEALIAAATGWIDGPGGWLGRAVGRQLLELVDCGFGNNALPYPPAIEIESIVYLDGTRTAVTMADTDYRLLINGSLAPAPNLSWPSVASDLEAVRVRYHAGYESVPPAIKQAILLLVGHWYANRETVVTGTIVAQMPFAVEALLSTYRVWSI